jgi:hypothetical protein
LSKKKKKKGKHSDPEPAECLSQSESPEGEGVDLFAANVQSIYSIATAQFSSLLHLQSRRYDIEMANEQFGR